MSSIPRPSAPIDLPPYPHPTQKLRDIPLVPPKFYRYPALPSPPRSPHFVPGYNVTTHIIPASYPRQSFREPRRYPHLEPVLSNPPPVERKAERNAWATDIRSKLRGKRAAILKLRAENHHSEALGESEESPVMWNVINRYARVGPPRGTKDIGITVVAAHAGGFHKEIWEPTFRHLISLCDRRASGIHIDEIWSIDAANSGDSALINEQNLGDVFDWIDYARDVINLVENFMPEGPFVASTHPLPVHLHRVSPDCSSRRQMSGFHNRNVLALGHSLGGYAVASAACANPNLFQSLTLVDPMILPQGNSQLDDYVTVALLRRQSWSSREEAKQLFLQNPFFKTWDPEVLDMYVQYGLAEIPKSEGGGVRLKMSGFQEAINFLDNESPREAYEALERLDEKVKIKWIMASAPLNNDPPEYAQAMVWRRPVNSANIKINSGHLVAHEAPLELAKEAVCSWQAMHAEKPDPTSARL